MNNIFLFNTGYFHAKGKESIEEIEHNLHHPLL